MTAEATVAAGPAAVAARHYLDRRALAFQVFDAATQWWGLLDPNDLASSWTDVVAPGLVGVVQAGQRIAAMQTTPYIDALDREWEIIGAPDYRLDAESYVGTTIDGRDLREIIESPMIVTRRLIIGGLGIDDALDQGKWRVQRFTVNEVQAAGNEADQAEATVRDYGGGYRILNLPCCSRCAVLAGKFYTWNAGFERHPNCDCTFAPTPEDLGEIDSREWDAEEAVASGQVTDLTDAERDAIINDGASLSRIVRGKITGMGYARGRGGRLTVKDIYDRAGDDRREAVRLLLEMGYIVRT